MSTTERQDSFDEAYDVVVRMTVAVKVLRPGLGGHDKWIDRMEEILGPNVRNRSDIALVLELAFSTLLAGVVGRLKESVDAG